MPKDGPAGADRKQSHSLNLEPADPPVTAGDPPQDKLCGPTVVSVDQRDHRKVIHLLLDPSLEICVLRARCMAFEQTEEVEMTLQSKKTKNGAVLRLRQVVGNIATGADHGIAGQGQTGPDGLILAAFYSLWKAPDGLESVF